MTLPPEHAGGDASRAPGGEGAFLRIEGVSKRFGSITAVDDVSLDIARGEFFALLGPSGCGKTTLLRMLAGFETPSAGVLLLEDVDLAALPPYRRPVNMMFQSYALFPHMTVAGNVAFGLRQDRVPKAEIAARVEEALALVELSPLARRKPHQLSGGQRQRVALARSLVKRPKLLLLDEPLAALDKKLREQTQFELMAIQQRVGITFVIVTHDQDEAMTVADRIAVMDRGRIAQVDTPSAIYEAPRSRYVAEFIGDVNIFEGARKCGKRRRYRGRSSRRARRAGGARTDRRPRSGRFRVARGPTREDRDRPRAAAGRHRQRDGRRGDRDRLSGQRLHLPGAARQRQDGRLDPDQPAPPRRRGDRPGRARSSLLAGRGEHPAPLMSGERRKPARARGLLGRGSVIASPYLWLLFFFLVPFAIVLKISVAEVQLAIPPYTPLFAWPEGGSFELFAVGDNYRLLIEDSLYIRAYANSLKIAAISTALALLVGFPVAYAMARAPRAWQASLVMLVILPFWTSFLIRVYAWIGILKNEGMLNGVLRWIGVIDKPLIILNTDIAVYIGIVYSYLPFMVLPLYANLVRMDRSLLEAAADLGCRPAGAFWKITVPLARPGIVAGCFLVFIPAVGEFVIPDLLGGSGTLMIGRILWTEFFSNRDWPVASAVAVILLLVLIVPIVLFQRHQQRQREA